MASDMDRAGIVRVAIAGQRYDVTSSGINYGTGGIKRNEILGADQFHGFSGEVVPAYIEFSVTDHKNLDVAKLQEIVDATVTASLFNGKTVVLSKAANTSDRTVSSTDGAITLRFVGVSLKEIPS